MKTRAIPHIIVAALTVIGTSTAPAAASVTWLEDWQWMTVSGVNTATQTFSDSHRSDSSVPGYFSAQVEGSWLFDSSNAPRVGGTMDTTEFSRGFQTVTGGIFDLGARTFASMYSNLGAGAENNVEFAVGVTTGARNFSSMPLFEIDFSNIGALLTGKGATAYSYGAVDGFSAAGQSDQLVDLKGLADDTIRITLPPGSYDLVGYVYENSGITGISNPLNLTGVCHSDPTKGCMDTQAILTLTFSQVVPEPPPLAILGLGLGGLGLCLRRRTA